MCIEESTLIKIRLCLWRVLINSFGIQRKELLIYILNETNCFECLFIENIKIRIIWALLRIIGFPSSRLGRVTPVVLPHFSVVDRRTVSRRVQLLPPDRGHQGLLLKFSHFIILLVLSFSIFFLPLRCRFDRERKEDYSSVKVSLIASECKL